MADHSDTMTTATAAPTAKEEVRALLDRLPEGLTLEDIQYHIGVYVTMTRRFEREGVTPCVPHSEVMRRIDAWFAK